MDAVIEDVAKAAEADAEKIAAEDAAKGPAGPLQRRRRRWLMTSLPLQLLPAPAST